MHVLELKNDNRFVETQNFASLQAQINENMPSITPKALYYLVYAILVALTFGIDNLLLKKTGKTSRVIGYILSVLVDLSIFGYGIYLYLAKGEDQTGFVWGGILCGICLLCLLGRYWQNKEADKKRKL